MKIIEVRDKNAKIKNKNKTQGSILISQNSFTHM